MRTLEVLERVLKGKRVKSDTQRHYRDALTSLARYEEEWPVSGVVINEWLASLGDKYADATIKNWFNFVNSAGKYMKKAYKLDNPCESADRVRVERKRRRYFSAEEMVSIIRACRFEQDKALVLTLIDSTCRVGELVGLNAENVGESWLNVKGKTGERRYRLDKVICEELRRLGADGEPIFKGRGGLPATVSSLKHRVRRIIKEAGLTGEKLGAHTLRHSGASLVAQATGSALAVKALLQHDKIDTSMEYIHDAEDVIQQRISPLRLVGEKAFGGVGGKVVEQVKQLSLGGSEGEVGTAVMKVDVEVPDVVVDLLDEQFPEIMDGVSVRPLLKEADLKLMRDSFLVWIRTGGAGRNEGKCRELMRRILRKKR